MSKIITIYCEGIKGSHDYDILDKIVASFKTSSIIIEPIGGIRGAGAIINYIEGAAKSDAKILFRDRDFDCPIPSSPILEQDKDRKYSYYSYRNTIENYLFDTSLFYNFVQEKGLSSQYSINNENDVKLKFIEAAEGIKYYQAVRHAMGKMRTGETIFGTKWTEKSGILPDDLSENACKKKALEKILNAKTLTEGWTETGLYREFDSFLAKFDDTFMNNLDFLIYFQGKDFASFLTSHLLPGFPMKPYYTYAKQKFDYTKFPDLQELFNLISSYL